MKYCIEEQDELKRFLGALTENKEKLEALREKKRSIQRGQTKLSTSKEKAQALLNGDASGASESEINRITDQEVEILSKINVLQSAVVEQKNYIQQQLNAAYNEVYPKDMNVIEATKLLEKASDLIIRAINTEAIGLKKMQADGLPAQRYHIYTVLSQFFLHEVPRLNREWRKEDKPGM